MKGLTEKERHTLQIIIRGARLRRASVEDYLVRAVAETLSPSDALYADIMELSRGCYEALLAGEDSEEMETWNRLWSATVKACRRRVC